MMRHFEGGAISTKAHMGKQLMVDDFVLEARVILYQKVRKKIIIHKLFSRNYEKVVKC